MSSPILQLLIDCKCDEVGGRYRATDSIGSGFGGSSFRGRDTKTNSPVFMKYLIAPRGPDESARFLFEVDALRTLSLLPISVGPKLLYEEILAEGAVQVLVTEWIDAAPLSDILLTSASFSAGEKLKLLQRITFATQCALAQIRHRDLHPGNILVLPDETVRMGPNIPNHKVETGIRIIDWGESTPTIFGNYDDEPEHHFIALEVDGKRLGGSFTSLPPDIFEQPSVTERIRGSYESWALGLIFIRLLLGTEPPRHNSLGHYRKALRNREIEDWTRVAHWELGELHLPGGDIIPTLVRGLLRTTASDRLSPADAKEILWDVLEEGLTLEDSDELARYFTDRDSYKPAGGWLYVDVDRD
jgi:serine/threonine protein kinase